MKYYVKESDKVKVVKSDNYNYVFNKENGVFIRFGKNKDNDPLFAPANEILDIEITDICKGVDGKPCKFCYKANTPNNKNNMSFDTFKKIIDKMKEHNFINQLAFGVDAQAESNPDLWKMADYARANGIIPNITVADISDEIADKLVKVMGAVAISRYSDKDICYNSVKKLTDRGLNQCNIHQLVSDETYEQIKETFNDIKTDKRLKDLNAIVLLSLKKKGRGKSFHVLSKEKFKKIVDLGFELGIPMGFDSCTQPKFLEAIKDRKNYKELEMMSEPCESFLFSAYINCLGTFYPCSFCEGEGEWKEGIDVINCNNFVKDVWFNPKANKFREKLLECNRKCPMFNV